MVIATVFLRLIVICHFEHRVCIIDSEVFKASWSFEFRISLYKMQSSAKSFILTGMSLMTSLIKTRKKSGPNTDPCGIPESTVAGVEAASLTWTHCFRNERYALIQLTKVSFFKMGFSLSSNLEWETRSNAFSKSRNIKSIWGFVYLKLSLSRELFLRAELR